MATTPDFVLDAWANNNPDGNAEKIDSAMRRCAAKEILELRAKLAKAEGARPGYDPATLLRVEEELEDGAALQVDAAGEANPLSRESDRRKFAAQVQRNIAARLRREAGGGT